MYNVFKLYINLRLSNLLNSNLNAYFNNKNNIYLFNKSYVNYSSTYFIMLEKMCWLLNLLNILDRHVIIKNN